MIPKFNLDYWLESSDRCQRSCKILFYYTGVFITLQHSKWNGKYWLEILLLEIKMVKENEHLSRTATRGGFYHLGLIFNLVCF
jgi:hypothetical protein